MNVHILPETLSTEQVDVKFPIASPWRRQTLKELQDLIPEMVLLEKVKTETQSGLVGSGMIGTLETPMKTLDFFAHLKSAFNLDVIKHTNLIHDQIKTVAVCGGAGGFLLNRAIAQQADIFITADYKYHEFFDADNRIIIADIGHFESEQFTINLLHQLVTEKFSNFAAYCTSMRTNPVHYFV